MSNPRQRPVSDPRKFINSVFDLAYGARDGSEKMSPSEIEADLREAGIDPNAAWLKFSKALHKEPQIESLAEVRRRRLSEPAPAAFVFINRARAKILEEINGLLVGAPAGVFARGWESASDEDLSAICEQIKRQKQRNQSNE